MGNTRAKYFYFGPVVQELSFKANVNGRTDAHQTKTNHNSLP